ncbi:MAG: carboxypeptidase-like regulatory domain-containing protein [Prevotella sp.]|nr:carboxypeptidase-like regulatory domain-containing protein [Prevotella sp.]
MKKLFLTLVVLTVVAFANAQKVSHTFNNVSISEALRQLNEQSTAYTIHFLYNELEDFRVTTSFKNKHLPDAIQQMIGFYPIRMTVTSDDAPEIQGKQKQQIFVECTHKTDRHLTGTIIDEQGQPVAYANIAILNPADSTLLSGGVSNESGYFAIPYEQSTVLACVSYVGYKTFYKLCKQPEMGTIRLQPDNIRLKTVIVTGNAIQNTSSGYKVSVKALQYAKDRMLADILPFLPGISVDKDKITILGNNVTAYDP